MIRPLLVTICLLLPTIASSAPRVLTHPWDPKEAVRGTNSRSMSDVIRYFNAQAGWPKLTQATKGTLVQRDLPGDVKYWELSWDHKEREFVLGAEFVPRDSADGTYLSLKCQLTYHTDNPARKAMVWRNWKNGPQTHVLWGEDDQVHLTTDDIDGWMVSFSSKGPPRLRKAFMGYPESEFFAIDSVLGAAPEGDGGQMKLKVSLKSGFTYEGSGRIVDGRIWPHGTGIFNFAASKDYLMGLFQDGKPYRCTFGTEVGTDILHRVARVEYGEVWSSTVSGSRIGTSVLADIYIGSDHVVDRQCTPNILRHNDGSYFFTYGDRGGQLKAHLEEEAARSAQVLAEPSNGSASGSRAFQLFPDKVVSDACTRCKGSGHVYEWGSVTQEMVLATDIDHTGGAWKEATVHRSGSLNPCPRCKGTGKR